ncbi:hypothetical protein F0L74_09135 [Chitinophaga agrisoli]|uniref:Uncharacterized protein n=1 Tax=Chitinophaga agrisoli TaxID=2607653 RepID=A0A5B2VWJ5_9BACT|nr:hypothetical protein [Chitinophaga agrisoli]KAA2242682.1 hypothetical protein F0L74_09135 [Chitinophaga agrisoli]
MGKQKGPVFIEGTFDGRTYYKLDGKYYVRKKSSLSARRVKRTPAFRRTMEYAGWMAQASVIGSAIYWKLPAKQRKRARYQALTGEAMRLLRDGVDEATVRAKLETAYLQKEAASSIDPKPVACADPKQTAAPQPEINEAGLKPVEKAASTNGRQPAIIQLEARSTAIIPAPASSQRQSRVLRFKAKRKHPFTAGATGNPPVAVPA